MKSLIILIVLSLLTFNLSANTKLLGPQKIGKSDSGIKGPDYAEMVEQMRTLANNHSEQAELIDLGSSSGHIETFGLLLRNQNIPTKKLILVTGATHGNEYLNIVDRLAAAFLDSNNREFVEFFNRGGAFFVVPVFNPDGYTSRRRYNDAGADLNRDYTNLITDIVRFNQPETQNMKVWLDGFLKEKEVKMALSMDYHCCYSGSLLFPWGFTKDKIPQTDRDQFNEVGEMMKKYFGRKAKYGAVSEIIWYLADGTSHDYYYAKYGSISMTYEGRYRKEKKLLAKHINWWKDIVARFGN